MRSPWCFRDEKKSAPGLYRVGDTTVPVCTHDAVKRISYFCMTVIVYTAVQCSYELTHLKKKKRRKRAGFNLIHNYKSLPTTTGGNNPNDIIMEIASRRSSDRYHQSSQCNAFSTETHIVAVVVRHGSAQTTAALDVLIVIHSLFRNGLGRYSKTIQAPVVNKYSMDDVILHDWTMSEAIVPIIWKSWLTVSSFVLLSTLCGASTRAERTPELTLEAVSVDRS